MTKGVSGVKKKILILMKRTNGCHINCYFFISGLPLLWISSISRPVKYSVAYQQNINKGTPQSGIFNSEKVKKQSEEKEKKNNKLKMNIKKNFKSIYKYMKAHAPLLIQMEAARRANTGIFNYGVKKWEEKIKHQKCVTLLQGLAEIKQAINGTILYLYVSVFFFLLEPSTYEWDCT